MTARRTLPLLELDPDLAQLLQSERREAAAQQLQVEVHRLPPGPWGANRLEGTNPEHVGLLILDGIVSREVIVSDTVSTELLGPGDVLRPWALHADAPLLLHEIRWNALTECRLAVLDRRFAARMSQWPEVNSVLIDRLNDRAQRLATTQAISQLNRVDRRLLALFWHLAERFGRVTSDGVAIPLTLSHRMLGQLVGARRPTVSTAIGDLAERDELVRRDDGTWLLKGDPVGLPTGEAQRIIPIRRRLFGRLPDEPADPLGVDPGAIGVEPGMSEPGFADLEHADPVVASAVAELQAALTKLRAEASANAGRMRELTAENEQLREEALTHAQELEAARHARSARRRPSPPRGSPRF